MKVWYKAYARVPRLKQRAKKRKVGGGRAENVQYDQWTS